MAVLKGFILFLHWLQGANRASGSAASSQETSTVTKMTSKIHFLFYAIAVAGFPPVGALQWLYNSTTLEGGARYRKVWRSLQSIQGGFRISNPKVRSNFQIRASRPGLTQPMGTNYHIWKVILRHSDDTLTLHTWLTPSLWPMSSLNLQDPVQDSNWYSRSTYSRWYYPWVLVHSFIPSKLLWLT